MNLETKIVVAVALALLLSAVGLFIFKKKTPNPEPPAYMEKVEAEANDIYAHIRPTLAPWDAAMASNANTFAEKTKSRTIQSLRTIMAHYGASDAGRHALAKLADDVRANIREARKQDRWDMVQSGMDIFGVFRQRSFFMKFYTELAERQLARPKVYLKGFLDDIEKDDTYAFLELRINGSNEVINKQVRVGEEFLDPPHTLKLLRIIGINHGVELEYFEIPGYTFEVMLKKDITIHGPASKPRPAS